MTEGGREESERLRLIGLVAIIPCPPSTALPLRQEAQAGESSCSQTLDPLLAQLAMPLSSLFLGESRHLLGQLPTSSMDAMENPEGQELQKLERGAWDNPSYSGPPSPQEMLRICTISTAALPKPQPRKPEDGPQEKTHRTLVSSCCLHFCRSIRGTG